MSRLKTIIDANIKENGNQEITGKTMNYVLTEIANDVNTDGYFPNMSVGFADNLVGRGESVPAEFTFRATGGKSIKDGAARIKRIKGNSVVWNNMVDTRHLSNEWSYQNDYMRLIQGHKYLFSRTMANAGIYCIPVIDGQEKYEYSMQLGVYSIIFTSAYDTTPSTTVIYNEKESGSVQLIDLTQMFQAGNEPSTIEEYEARKPIVADEYAYNEGEVIHMNTESIKSVGDNAWDEQWEVGGLSQVTGQEHDVTTTFRSKNYIKILPNTQYYFRKPAGVFLIPYYYDEDKNFIAADDVLYTSENGNAFTTMNAAYMRFIVNQENYHNDIMLTLVHSGWKQDTDAGYQEYWEDTLPLSIVRKYFPQGMKSAGSACDVIDCKKKQAITNVGVASNLSFSQMQEGVFYVDLPNMKLPTSTMERMNGIFTNRYVVETDSPSIGNMADKSIIRFADGNIYIKDMSYTNSDEFNAANTDLVVCYELAEPIVIEIDEPFGTDYRVADFGTEQAISSVPSAPFSADIIYQFNAVDMIRENYNEIQKLKEMLNVMSAQLAAMNV